MPWEWRKPWLCLRQSQLTLVPDVTNSATAEWTNPHWHTLTSNGKPTEELKAVTVANAYTWDRESSLIQLDKRTQCWHKKLYVQCTETTSYSTILNKNQFFFSLNTNNAGDKFLLAELELGYAVKATESWYFSVSHVSHLGKALKTTMQNISFLFFLYQF